MLKYHYPEPLSGSIPKKRLFPNNPNRLRFDFEIGHLVRSPCKGCTDRPAFPGCIDSCLNLDRLHEILSHGVSCARKY